MVPSVLMESRSAVGVAADVGVVRRARQGDIAAFTVLARAVSPSVFRFLRGRCLTPSEAEEALQETLISAWRSLPRLRHDDRFVPWVFGIAAHRAGDAHRHRRSYEPMECRNSTETDDAPPALFELLARLPVAHQEVLLLRYLVGLSEAETAVALGVRVGTVKSRTARGAQALRLAFSEQGETP